MTNGLEPQENEPQGVNSEERLHYMEEANRWTLEALGMVSALSDFHATISGKKSQ
jgi:hypothetical protein